MDFAPAMVNVGKNIYWRKYGLMRTICASAFVDMESANGQMDVYVPKVVEVNAIDRDDLDLICCCYAAI